MAVSPIPPLPPAVRSPGFVPALVAPVAPSSPAASFTRLVENARAAGAALPVRGFEAFARMPDGLSTLDRALLRDLVAGFEQVGGAAGALGSSPTFLGNPGAGMPGLGGMPESLRNLGAREALALYASVSSLATLLQAVANDAGGGPSSGGMLDLSA